MPNDNDNNDLSDLSIEQINDIYSDIIEIIALSGCNTRCPGCQVAFTGYYGAGTPTCPGK